MEIQGRIFEPRTEEETEIDLYEKQPEEIFNFY